MSATHQLRCTNCGTRIAGEAVSANFRCPECQGLYEVVYPWSQGAASQAAGTSELPSDIRFPNPSALRWLWQERRTNNDAIDQSGVFGRRCFRAATLARERPCGRLARMPAIM